MHTPLRTTLFLLLLGSAGLTQAADVTIKPGLWVISHQGNMSHGGMNMKMPSAQEMQAMMKNLPPEARAQMEKNMGPNGMAMMTDEGVKVCVSPEQAAQNSFATPPTSECKVVNQSRTGNTISIKMQCPQGEMESTVTLQSDTAWSSTMKGQMQHDGQNSSMDMQASGKWLSADCGTLKPMGAAAAQTK
jgi:hypothetical protein